MTIKPVETTRLSKRHTRYYAADGALLPGITTVTGQLDKPALAVAANRLGLQGIDSGVHWKGLAAIGTLAHLMLEHQLNGTDPTEELRDFTENEQARARNSVRYFEEWVAGRDFKFVKGEFPLVSEKHRYGGTGDCLAYINGRLSYCDFKTGGLYLEADLQGAANAELLNENGLGPIEQIVLLGLPRVDDETFHQKVITDWSEHFRLFLALLEVYRIKQGIESIARKSKKEAALVAVA